MRKQTNSINREEYTIDRIINRRKQNKTKNKKYTKYSYIDQTKEREKTKQ